MRRLRVRRLPRTAATLTLTLAPQLTLILALTRSVYLARAPSGRDVALKVVSHGGSIRHDA